ncbi:MAG: M20/M25/M40 family metallo-hydrolase, partial [Candidatus Hydrogenedentota bacterium]
MRARVVLGIFLAASWAGQAGEPVDLQAVTDIRYEGFHNSHVMDTIQHLTDEIGPRLTNSPQQREAAEWCRTQLEDWGLKDAALETWGEFGRGWSFDRCAVHLLKPHAIPLIALPRAWTPGTEGPVRGLCTRVTIKTEEDMEKYKGTLNGKIVLADEPRDPKLDTDPAFTRHSVDDLCALEEFKIPSESDANRREEGLKAWKLGKKRGEFFRAEGVLAVIELSSRDAGVVRVMGVSAYKAGEASGPTILTMAAEHYDRLVRYVDDEQEVELEIDVHAQFHEEDLTAQNVVAEIPGHSKRGEVVMLGGHLDSWHGGSGATDNAAGVSVAMEAVRILKAIDAKPKRTIRIALWTGEEQGLLGSRGYVEKHFAYRPKDDPSEEEIPRFYREPKWPLTTRPEHKNLSAYFNLDNGSGKIRGIYCQENAAVQPIFDAWLAPFADLGATTTTLLNTSST